MNPQERERKIQEHLSAIRQLEAESAGGPEGQAAWPPDRFYLVWHLVFGMMLGSLGAVVSLAANFIGAPLFGEQPMQLIRVYLTFPMGEQALSAQWGPLLAVGSLLYIVTGALYGIVFHLLMLWFYSDASPRKRLLVGSLFGLLLWVVNFYGILIWLQPLLQGGNWIVRLVPPWVAALTHLAFAWTMLLGLRFSEFDPRLGSRRGQPEKEPEAEAAPSQN